MTRALVFAHYDRDGIIDDYVADALAKYRPCVDRVACASASAARLPPALEQLVDYFVPRDNVGYDFCSLRAGLEALGPLECYDEVLFANDSVYGPLFDLGPVLADRRAADADMWGMCLSGQGTKRRGKRTSCPHIQSWFFAMRRPVLASEAFRQFWDSVVPLDNKDDIIDRYEIGMTEHFVRAGFQIATLYDARANPRPTWAETRANLSLREPMRSGRHLRKVRRSLHNPSELFPLRLIDAGVPFVKASVFRVNHYGLNLDLVLRGIRERTAYDVGLIERHLARVGRGA